MSGQVAFAWIGNASFAFLITAIIVLTLIRIVRPPPNIRLCLSLLPFARLGLDLRAGIPSDVHVWYGLKGDFLKQVVVLLGHEGQPCHSRGIFCFGASPDALGHYPTRLVAGVKAGVDGQWHSLGIADILSKVLDHWVEGLPSLLVVTMVAVGGMIAVRRLLCAWGFEKALASNHVFALRRSSRALVAGRRHLSVRCPHEGSPFTGGLLRPYVCFPLHTFKTLSPSERRAALAHEVAHVRRLDAFVITLVGVVRDIFWFVPLIGAARRQLLYTLELAADASGARVCGSAVTASAILRVGESLRGQPAIDRYSLGAMSDVSLLRGRVETLLRPAPSPFSLSSLCRLAVTAAVAFVTLTSAFLGYR